MGTCMAQPLNSSNTQHTVTAHPRQLLRLALSSLEILSIGGTMGPQKIEAPCFLDLPQSHHTFPSSFKAPTVHVGILALNKLHPQLGVA